MGASTTALAAPALFLQRMLCSAGKWLTTSTDLHQPAKQSVTTHTSSTRLTGRISWIVFVFFLTSLPRCFTLVAMQRRKRETAKVDDTSVTRMDYEARRDWNMHHVAYGERLSGDGVNNRP